MSDLIQELFDRISRVDGPVLTDLSGGTRRSVDGRNLVDQLDRLAASLDSGGIRSGDRVVAMFDNTIEAALTLLMAMRHGITLCLQPAGTPLAELAKLRQDLEAKAIINATRTDMAGTTPIQLEGLAAHPPVSPAPVAPRTHFTITFTSGSTGIPKGIVHSADSFLTCAEVFNRQTGITEQDRFLNVMPMFYMAGIFNGILAPLAAGASVVIADAFNTATAMRFWPTLAAEEISALWLSPTMLSLVVRLDRTDKTVPSGFRRLFVGTGAMTAADAGDFQKTYGLPPLQSYGLSELLYISIDDATAPNFGTVGHPIDGVTLTCGREKPLSIMSHYAFLGYLVDGALQPHHGLFLSSDLADLSHDGTLSILGRADDIILRGGANVNPVELETALAPVMAGRAFCITGLPDEILGQKVVLITEGHVLSDDTFAKAQRVVRDHPGRAQLDTAALVDKLPVGPTGKVRRSALRTMLDKGDA